MDNFHHKYKYKYEISAFARWLEHTKERKNIAFWFKGSGIRFKKRLESASFARWVDYA